MAGLFSSLWWSTVLPGGIEPTFEVPETPVLSIELWELLVRLKVLNTGRTLTTLSLTSLGREYEYYTTRF